MIAQIFIGLFGATAIWMIGRNKSWSKWGYVVGLASQPFWIYETITQQQWGILFLCIFYLYSWSEGVFNNFFKKS